MVRLPARRLLAGALALSGAYVLARDLDRTPYDDAYFFKRFSRNLLEHGSFAWNPEDGPVHGLTSELLALASIVFTAVAREHVVLATKLFLAACLLAAGVRFFALVSRSGVRADVGVAVTLLVFGCPLTAWTVHTGMETALAVFVTVSSLAPSLERSASRRRALEAAGLTALAYLARPDVALIPALSFLVAHGRDRRRSAEFLLVLAALFGSMLVAFRLYYGTALPLPFYVKTLGAGPYDDAFAALARRDKLLHLVTFAAFAAPLIGLSRARADRRGLALVVAGVSFVGYHALATTEVMGYRARFYVPALVPLGFAAALGAEQALATNERRRSWFAPWVVAVAATYVFDFVSTAASSPLERLPWTAYATQVALAGWLAFSAATPSRARPALAAPLLLLALGMLASLPPRRPAFASDEDFLAKSSAEVTTFRGVFDVARCLPQAITVYHSELGVTGLVLPEARIVDLTGLMSPRAVFEAPPFDAHCTRERPEALFLPHKNYVELNREIAASACVRGYTRVVRVSSSPLLVRNDVVADFRRCSRDIAHWQ